MKPKTFITDEFGNLNMRRFIVLFIGLVSISYLTSFNWFKSDFKGSAKQYVSEINRKCPIEHSENVFLDSVTYDGDRIITQYISGHLKEMDQTEFANMKNLMIENTKNKLAANQKAVELISHQNFVIIHKVLNRNNKDQSFQYSIDKNLFSENTDEID